MTSPQPSAVSTVIWVERLTACGALRLGLRALATGTSVRFDENQATSAGAAVAALFGSRFTPARLRLNLVDARGEGLVYRRCEHLTAAVSAFCARVLSDATERERRMVQCFLGTELLARFGFLTMIERAAEEFPGARHEARVRGHYLNAVLRERFEAAGFRMSQSLPGPEGLRFAAIPFVLIARSAWSRARGAVPMETPRPAVWIEQAPQGAVWDQFQALAGRFVSATAREYDVVYYFDRSDTPCDDETVRRLAAAGLKTQALFDPAAESASGPGELAAAARAAWRSTPPGPWWLAFLRAQAAILRALYAGVFRAHRVKALIQHQEASWKQEPKALALEDAGGVMLGLHWSCYEHYDFPTHLTPQHAFFVWGDAHREILEKRGNACSHILPAGIWMPSRELPAPAFAPGVRFKLAVFDSDAYYDLYMSPESFLRFYTALADLLERRRDLAVLLKPKTITAVTSGLEILRAIAGGVPVAERFERLRAEGRFVALDGGAYTPLDAAGLADIAVSFGLNTAGFLAAARGTPSLQWDCTGWLRHPLYAVAGQQVAFTSLEALIAAVERRYAGDRAVGDLGAFGRRVNHFGDFLGFERMFGFIDVYMGRLSSGDDAKKALDEAAADYRRRHSVDGRAVV